MGLDTPAGTVELLNALKAQGYGVEDIPSDGNALIDRIKAGPTNAATSGRRQPVRFSLDEYLTFFQSLDIRIRNEVNERWGTPESDPFFVDGMFALPAFACGNITIGLQPAWLQHRSGQNLSRPGPDTPTRISRLLRVAAKLGACHCSHGQTWQSGVASR